ncbi:outer membrane protein assembly factor BamE [Methylomarinum sp. Ch1-1]|uniref:Outer membrane protein assembly factor BamE n=1 Tax=Methylomarinum roseum TaxID=3067653 RepID=A0AAU7NWC1_9GAMM|nr:outer membrane protein assembly factor BamE [Methylomarinum sp. Ch1-1]MDP4522682.1 outer membrane protein assembly factor BamE [Methylomarinum sp. Ch1-1]
MKMGLFRITVLLSVLSLVSGCASIGREFPSSQVSVITIGETTQRQIRSMFGAPWRVGIENGQRTWTYGHYQYSLFGEGSTEDLVVRFDNRGIVASYVFNTTEHQEGAPVAGQ